MEQIKSLLQYRDYDELNLRDEGEEKQQERGRTSRLTRNLLVIVLTVVNVGSLMTHGVLFVQGSNPSSPARNQHLRDCSSFSPFFDRLDIPYTVKQINGSLANEDNSIWRQPPSPEVDEAWERVSKLGVHVISGADVVALGKDPDMTVRAPVSWDLGDDAHLVQLDVTHQIHCLNAIRKAMYPEYYPVRKLLKDVHPQHCLHLLLQNLMCDASMGAITYNWMETQMHPFPDMSINRQCREFDAVLKWHEDNLVPLTERVVRPAGARELPLTPKLKELMAAHKGEDTDETVGGMHG